MEWKSTGYVIRYKRGALSSGLSPRQYSSPGLSCFYKNIKRTKTHYEAISREGSLDLSVLLKFKRQFFPRTNCSRMRINMRTRKKWYCQYWERTSARSCVELKRMHTERREGIATRSQGHLCTNVVKCP